MSNVGVLRRNTLRAGACEEMGKPHLEKCRESSLTKVKCVHEHSGAWRERMSQSKELSREKGVSRRRLREPSRKLES